MVETGENLVGIDSNEDLGIRAMVKTEVKLEKVEDIKTNRGCMSSSDIDSIVSDRQKFKRSYLCRAKPSYLLSLGPKASRSEHLNRLPRILRELLRKRNWSDASRVLTVLMKGTIKDHCPKMNRLKYEAHIEILNTALRLDDNMELLGHLDRREALGLVRAINLSFY